MKNKTTLIINTCNKFSDLWVIQCSLLNRNWPDRACRTILLSDELTEFSFPRIEVISAGRGKDIVQRLKYVIDSIDTEYVFLTLDDYFLVRKAEGTEIRRLIKCMEKYDLDYIRLFKYPVSRCTKRIPNESYLRLLTYDKRYDVNLYPGLWKTSFLKETLKNDNLDAWSYEVSLTKTAKNIGAKSAWYQKNPYPILDAVRKGKFLHKAKRFIRYYGRYVGNRETISYFEEARLFVMRMINTYLSDNVRLLLKEKLKKKGMRFYSNE